MTILRPRRSQAHLRMRRSLAIRRLAAALPLTSRLPDLRFRDRETLREPDRRAPLRVDRFFAPLRPVPNAFENTSWFAASICPSPIKPIPGMRGMTSPHEAAFARELTQRFTICCFVNRSGCRGFLFFGDPAIAHFSHPDTRVDLTM